MNTFFLRDKIGKKVIQSRAFPIGCYVGVFVLLLFSVVPFRGYDLGTQIDQRKMWNCFVGWQGVVVFILLTAGCIVLGWPAFKEYYRRASLGGLWGLMAAFAVVNLWIGAFNFGPRGFFHYMFWWSVHDYLYLAGQNASSSFYYTAIIIMFMKPWKIVPEKGLTRVVLMAIALMLVNYGLAYLGYAFYNCDIVE